MSRKKTKKEIEKEIFDKVGNEYSMIGEYKDKSTKVLMRHNTCGKEWKVTISNFFGNRSKKGTRCPSCSLKNGWSKRSDKKDLNKVKIEVENHFDNKIKVLKVYRNKDDKNTVWVKLQCDIHSDEIWDTRYNNAIRQTIGCKKCSRTKPYSLEEKIALIKERGYEIISYSKNHKNFCIYCSKHDIKMFYKWTTIRDGRFGCKLCNKENYISRTLSIDEVKSRLKNISPNIEILSKTYTKAHDKLKCQCLKCNNVWFVTWANLSRGRACPKCRKSNNNKEGYYSIYRANKNKSKWLNKKTSIYIINMKNKEENFYKIGISKNVKNRLKTLSLLYDTTLLYKYQTNLYDSIYLEKALHCSNSIFSYTPLKQFNGYTECFSQIDLNKIKHIIREYKD